MHSLAVYCPLYIAIVLEQGQFSWRQHFLESFDREDNIKTLLGSEELNKLSPATKQVLFKLWENSFENYLEPTHG